MTDPTLSATWIDGDDPSDVIPIHGGLRPPPSWDEYLNLFPDDLRAVLTAVRDTVLRDQLGGRCGDEMNDGYFALSDGRSIAFTQRAWGDLVQSIANKREGYMMYFTRSWREQELQADPGERAP